MKSATTKLKKMVNFLTLNEDGFVYRIKAVKTWGRKGQIIITENNII